jgi:catechol 2,3-dioxygenase-like lactoylglutathione lyase family enzyme
MKPGDYVEIRTTVGDIAEAQVFYEKLGFKAVGGDVVTDGSINIRLLIDDEPSPSLGYAGSDVAAITTALGFDTPPSHDSTSFTAPDGLNIRLDAQASSVPMPTGTPMSRTAISHLGKFGEFALPVADRDAAIAFWEKLGFEQMYAADEPYPFVIISDGLIVLGLHQTSDFDQPHVTYFAADMAARIARLQADGVVVRFMSEDDKSNAAFTAPGGQRFFLFVGEV